MPKRSNGFDKSRERAIAAGKKSSRAVPVEVKAARIVNAIRFEEIVYKYMSMNGVELQAVAKDPSTPAIDLVVIKILSNAITKGDLPSLNLLLERTVGKVKDKLEINANVQSRTLHEQIMDEIVKNETGDN